MQEQIITTLQPVVSNPRREVARENMEISDQIPLRELFIDHVEKFMDEFVGTSTELRGLFKIHTSTAVDSNLQQVICSTAKEWYEKSVFGEIEQKKHTEN